VTLYLVTAVGCYLIGSFPTAYVVVKVASHSDIRYAGTGNVGGLNAYEVTHSRTAGTIVILVDALKGAAALLATRLFLNSSGTALSLAFFSVVIGHCYPVWLKFHGGRGLATAAGGMMFIGWFFVALWMSVWLVAGFFSKNIHIRNVSAILMSPVIVSMIPHPLIQELIQPEFSSNQFIALAFIVCGLLLLRHIQPLRELTNASKGIDTQNKMM